MEAAHVIIADEPREPIEHLAVGAQETRLEIRDDGLADLLINGGRERSFGALPVDRRLALYFSGGNICARRAAAARRRGSTAASV